MDLTRTHGSLIYNLIWNKTNSTNLQDTPLTFHHKRKSKVKVKLYLCLTKHHAVKTYWGRGGIAPHIDLGDRWGGW
jgi:hypothetical protein